MRRRSIQNCEFSSLPYSHSHPVPSLPLLTPPLNASLTRQTLVRRLQQNRSLQQHPRHPAPAPDRPSQQRQIRRQGLLQRKDGRPRPRELFLCLGHHDHRELLQVLLGQEVSVGWAGVWVSLLSSTVKIDIFFRCLKDRGLIRVRRRECYCGDNMVGIAPAPKSECSSTCAGNAGNRQAFCGGPGRLNGYYYSGFL